MNHKDLLGHITPCGIINNTPSIEQAGKMVDLDLSKPIDCSQMVVREVSSETKMEDYDYGKMYVDRTCVLHAYVINDKGEQEELTITFKLKSQRQPR